MDLTGKKFFYGSSWFKLNNLGLALCIALKLYTRATEMLKLKVRKFFGLILPLVKVAGEKLLWGSFNPTSWIGSRTVLCNYSLNSCSDISKIFAAMFKYPVADAFKLGSIKCWYLMRYGFAPCFSGLLEGKFKKFHFMVPHLVKVLIKSVKSTNGLACQILEWCF